MLGDDFVGFNHTTYSVNVNGTFIPTLSGILTMTITYNNVDTSMIVTSLNGFTPEV